MKSLEAPANLSIDQYIKMITDDSSIIDRLPEHDLKLLVKHALIEKGVKEIKTRSFELSLNIYREAEEFVDSKESEHTKVAYRYRLDVFMEWAQSNGKTVPGLKAKDIRSYHKTLWELYDGTTSVDSMIATPKAFLSYLCDKYHDLPNPFTNLKLKAGKKGKIFVPSEHEIMITAQNSRDVVQFAIILMYWNGLRIGAFRKIRFSGHNFHTVSKGKSIYGKLHPNVIEYMEANQWATADLLQSIATQNLKSSIINKTKYLARIGAILHKFSPHKLRHACALRIYSATKDINAVRDALGHDSITTSETYLRGLMYSNNLTNLKLLFHA